MSDNHPAKHYSKVDGSTIVVCNLCSRKCRIGESKRGFCKSRVNVGGELFTTNYGHAVAINMDPIEKKPLYHFLPGRNILSLGTNYCNLACKFCQNSEISQHNTGFRKVTPDYIAALAVQSENCCGLAFTYNEPTIWFEFVLDSSRIALHHGLKNVLVTNGDIAEKPLEELAPFISAMNIDLKAYSDAFYREQCGGGSLMAVLKTISRAYSLGIHVEVTNLVIPALNDSERMISDLVDFIAGVSTDIPLHFSRYHPAYLLEAPPTPIKTLNSAFEIASKKLKFVYLGNVADVAKNSTWCPTCKSLLVERHYFSSRSVGLAVRDGAATCRKCGEVIYGIFS